MKIKALIASVICASVMLSSCNGAKADTVANRVSRYLGDVDYASTVSALVYEQIPEEEGRYGIVYRAVSDIDGLLSQTKAPVCLYFFDYMSSGETSGVTAGVEDLAQSLSDQVIFVAVDGISEHELGDRYGVEAYPEFVLLTPGKPDSKFEGMNYESWNVMDVAYWMAANGYSPDFSKLEG